MCKKACLTAFPDVPQPPTNVHLTSCTGRRAMFAWQVSNIYVIPAVTSYIIEFNTSFAPHDWQMVDTREFKGEQNILKHDRVVLSPWANYTFRVTLRNELGQGQASHVTREWCATPADRPRNHPRNVCTLNGRPGTLTITWQVWNGCLHPVHVRLYVLLQYNFLQASDPVHVHVHVHASMS